jgi:hypothetical protein
MRLEKRGNPRHLFFGPDYIWGHSDSGCLWLGPLVEARALRRRDGHCSEVRRTARRAVSLCASSSAGLKATWKIGRYNAILVGLRRDRIRLIAPGRAEIAGAVMCRPWLRVVQEFDDSNNFPNNTRAPAKQRFRRVATRPQPTGRAGSDGGTTRRSRFGGP